MFVYVCILKLLYCECPNGQEPFLYAITIFTWYSVTTNLFSSWISPLALSFPLWSMCVCYGSLSLLQMEVVSTFKRSGSFQGAVRRRSSVLSQLHDVTNISTPTHVVLSTANASAAPGSESPCFPCDRHNTHCIHRNIGTLYTETDAHISHL